jgi:hypothetical protein
MMEIKLGRLLKPHEVVDHIDGCHLNNSLENLRVFGLNKDHLKKTISVQVPQWSPEGKAKLILKNLDRDLMKKLYPEQIHNHNSLKKSGDVRLQQILRAYDLHETHPLCILGTKKYLKQMNIPWPYDQKKESYLKNEYLKILLRHPMLKLWIEG